MIVSVPWLSKWAIEMQVIFPNYSEIPLAWGHKSTATFTRLNDNSVTIQFLSITIFLIFSFVSWKTTGFNGVSNDS